MNMQEGNVYDSSLDSKQAHGSIKRGRKASLLEDFERQSNEKIAELKRLAREPTLNALQRRLYRNKASAQQSRLDKKLAYYRLKQQFKAIRVHLDKILQDPNPTKAKLLEVLQQPKI